MLSSRSSEHATAPPRREFRRTKMTQSRDEGLPAQAQRRDAEARKKYEPGRRSRRPSWTPRWTTRRDGPEGQEATGRGEEGSLLPHVAARVAAGAYPLRRRSPTVTTRRGAASTRPRRSAGSGSRSPPPRFEGFRSARVRDRVGMAYEVTKNGNVDRNWFLPVETFRRTSPFRRVRARGSG